MRKISRRNFLKIVGAATPTVLFPSIASWASKNLNQVNKPNIIILLFDAMSARNLSLYGYPRLTSRNLERFAERATVYHSHYSAGNYTIPGTASLLTGTYPWTHRAINYSGGTISNMVENDIFHALGKEYYRLCFPQNLMANFVVSKFNDDIDHFLPADTFGKLHYLLNNYFPNDRNLSLRVLDDFMFQMQDKPPSLVFGSINWSLYYRDSQRIQNQDKEYPRGLPYDSNYPIFFSLEELFGGLADLVPSLQGPFFSYLHVYPPHAPYRATKQFDSKFIDGWWPEEKPVHRFSNGFSYSKLTSTQRSYDEYIASADWEFGKLLDVWEASGIFDNSYVIITSDHGELFERGETRHNTALLYDPIVRIPLMISAPGQKTRQDIYAPTNSVDVLPTLLQLIGKPIPSQTEGKLLPGFGGVEDYERSTFTVEAKHNSAFTQLKKATFAMRKGNYKLIYYTGYESEDSFELYDLENDIEELKDLMRDQPAIFKLMKEELFDSLSDADRPYTRA